MNLRDQLLKAGLVSKKQAEKAESDRKKQDHDARKNKELADQLKAQKETELGLIEEAKTKQREIDQELNKQRDLLVAQREAYFRAGQILNSNCLNDAKATELYFFQEGQKIRKVLVTPWQREMLARGKMAIGRPQEDVDEFVLIPLAAAKLLLEVFPQKVLTLFDELDDNAEL